MGIRYDDIAADYALHRGVHPEVLRHLLKGLDSGQRLLGVDRGTGNHPRAITREAACEVWGVEPSREMLGRAREAVPSATSVQGCADRLGVPDAHPDRVISVDVIHSRDRGGLFEV